METQLMERTESAQERIAEYVEQAKVITRFVESQQLFSVIRGKRYVRVEGWLFLGRMNGCAPVVKSVEHGRDEGRFWAAAHVDVVNVNTGLVVGSGFGYCSQSETTWRDRDEMAIIAMAQTRATSRSMRMFSFVLHLAGWETVSFEEMPAAERAAERSADALDAGAVARVRALVTGERGEEARSFLRSRGYRNLAEFAARGRRDLTALMSTFSGSGVAAGGLALAA